MNKVLIACEHGCYHYCRHCGLVQGVAPKETRMSDIVEDPSDSLRHEIERIIYGDIKSRDPAIDREIGQILALVERYQELQHEELVQEIVKTDTEARINELRRLYPSFTVDGHFSIDGEKIVERLATLYSRRKS